MYSCIVYTYSARLALRRTYDAGKMTYHKKACEIPKSQPKDAGADFRWSVAAKLPCRVNGPHCHNSGCHPDDNYCESASCPRPNCGAETCPGWLGRRKLVLQLPMRHSATHHHGDHDIRRRRTASQSCHASTIQVSTTVMRMIEWQGLPFYWDGGLECAAEGQEVSCPEGYTRDTFMRHWEERHAASAGDD